MTCKSCSKVPLPANAAAGKCANCKGFTSSRAIKLCSSCSSKLDQCDRCQKPLTAKDKKRKRSGK